MSITEYNEYDDNNNSVCIKMAIYKNHERNGLHPMIITTYYKVPYPPFVA